MGTRTWRRAAAGVAALAALAGGPACGGGDGGGAGPPTLHAGTVDLPASLPPEGLTLLLLGGEATPAADGTFTAESPAGGAPWLAMAVVGDDVPAALTFVDPAVEAVTLSCAETAASLAVLRSGLVALPGPALAAAVAEARARPEVAALGGAVCAALAADPEALGDEDAALAEAARAAAEALDAHLRALYAPAAP